ncbi:hypothetical protein ACFQU2_18145 [Siccirubricoccus deserti]|uniref:Uncharacterized protein n=1 Tax=Siccirubricoccus deserti TaxID=2013562 RepID=A0A9X0R634_9PROT|nr:hypothetical protein [Siccirubricoccus deserti]MBC4019067.1 hypothetical protein [Siccirubricoccus deserti]
MSDQELRATWAAPLAVGVESGCVALVTQDHELVGHPAEALGRRVATAVTLEFGVVKEAAITVE